MDGVDTSEAGGAHRSTARRRSSLDWNLIRAAVRSAQRRTPPTNAGTSRKMDKILRTGVHGYLLLDEVLLLLISAPLFALGLHVAGHAGTAIAWVAAWIGFTPVGC